MKKLILFISFLLVTAVNINAQESVNEGLSAAGIIESTILNSGLNAATDKFRELRSAPVGRYQFLENEFNNLGYRLIRQARFKDAVSVFEMNIVLFPVSANVYSSLSEGLLYLGNETRAEDILKEAMDKENTDDGYKEQVARFLKDFDITLWSIISETKEIFRFKFGEPTGLKNPYLGQEPPLDEPKIFAPGIVSTVGVNDFCASFSSDGTEFYFNRGMTIMVCHLKKEGWTAPEPATFNGKYRNHEAHLTSDNKRLFFGGSRPPQPYGIWLTERTETGWSEPKRMWDGMYVSSSRKGNLYYGSEDPFPAHINCISYVNGNYLEPQAQEILLVKPDGKVADIFHPAIAPDESYIVFDDNNQLYVSFKEANDTWGKPICLSESIRKRSACIPSISPDGKYLFFNSHNDLLWISTGVIEKIRNKSD